MRERPLSSSWDDAAPARVTRRGVLARFVGALVGVVATAAPVHAADEPRGEPPTVAVLYFDYEGKNHELEPLRKGLAQMLTTDLAELDSIRVVERARLEEVLAELALGRSAKVDRASASRVGKLLGARLLVLGSFFEIGGALRVDARVVDSESGRILKGAGVRGKSDDALACEATLAEKLREALGALSEGTASSRVAAAARPSAPSPAATAERAAPRTPPLPRAAPGAKVHVSALAAYGRALDALDKKDAGGARSALEAAVRISPGFRLASGDLERLAR